MEQNMDEALSLDNQLCFPLYAAARRVTGEYTPCLKPLGLTYTQYLVLLVLWEKDGIPVGEICSRLFLDNGTVTPLLKKMEQQGYLRRTRCRDDERCVLVTLTECGNELKHKVKDIPFRVGGCLNLNAEEAQELYRLLRKIIGKEK